MRKIFIASVALALMGSDCGSTKDHTGHTFPGRRLRRGGEDTRPHRTFWVRPVGRATQSRNNAYWQRDVYTVGWIAEVRLCISQTGVGVSNRPL
ncbi:MAG: hypothetical protein H6741_19265 [Alphaproteobacteria bacterium]|nr:hypothetical protein [Alphaproteobacteria bacterium]